MRGWKKCSHSDKLGKSPILSVHENSALVDKFLDHDMHCLGQCWHLSTFLLSSESWILSVQPCGTTLVEENGRTRNYQQVFRNTSISSQKSTMGKALEYQCHRNSWRPSQKIDQTEDYIGDDLRQQFESHLKTDDILPKEASLAYKFLKSKSVSSA